MGEKKKYNKSLTHDAVRRQLRKELKKHDGAMAVTAAALGIHNSTLWRKLQQLGLLGYARRLRAAAVLREPEKGGGDGT